MHADLSLKMWEGKRCERVHYSITLARWLSVPPIEREKEKHTHKRACVRARAREMRFKVPSLLLVHLLTSLTDMFHLRYSRHHSLPCTFYPADVKNINSHYGERYCLIFQGRKDGIAAKVNCFPGLMLCHSSKSFSPGQLRDTECLSANHGTQLSYD